MMLTDLAQVLRDAGLRVIEQSNWKTRGHGPQSTVSSVVVHHTAGAATGENPSLRTVRDGRPGLGGPLAHILVGRSGTWYVVAAGKCWHAGATREPWQANEHSLGIEAEGTGRDTWPSMQMDSIVKGTRALADHYRVPYAKVLGHKEVCRPAGRKIDPNFSMGEFRSRLVAVGAGLPVLRRGDSGPLVERLQRWLGVVRPGGPGYGQFGPLTESKVRAYQEMRGLVVDGVVGAAMYREMGWL